jgi:uncharacterized membrane protein
MKMSDPDMILKPTKPQRRLKLALAVSLAFNLLIIGVFIGAIFAFRGQFTQPDHAREFRHLGLAPFALTLDAENRAALYDRIARDDVRAARRDIGQAMRQFSQSLQADPFDAARAHQALLSARQAFIGLQSVGHAALVDHLETLTAEDRAQVARRLRHVLRRGEGHQRQ